MNSGKAMVNCSPVKAAACVTDHSFRQVSRGHREGPLKQGRAVRLWNGALIGPRAPEGKAGQFRQLGSTAKMKPGCLVSIYRASL